MLSDLAAGAGSSRVVARDGEATGRATSASTKSAIGTIECAIPDGSTRIGAVVAAAAGVADCAPATGPVVVAEVGGGVVGRTYFAAATTFSFLERSALEVSAAALLWEATGTFKVEEVTGGVVGAAPGTTGATARTDLHNKE